MADPIATAPAETRTLADFLLSEAAGLKLRPGLLNGRRVEFFKGKHAVNALVRASAATAFPIADRASGERVLQDLVARGFVCAVHKPETGRTLSLPNAKDVDAQTTFSNDRFYIWIYRGSQVKRTLAGIGVVVLVLAGVMFPLWPASLRLGVYYLSLGLLGVIGLFFLLTIVRLIIYLALLLVTGQHGWLFPNLFADVGIVDSFIPTWGWDVPSAKKSRAAGAGASVKGAADVMAAEASAMVEDADDADDAGDAKKTL
ncbi:hypothetical protein CXG81DRAFT_9079 [Caulochytrium protostelioides]|uniref:Translocation protein SEC62 n=1 Tax=Caulochytrium protostelioides TaxID=1555241 RepID=A0A4P9XE20_9FUNG|nr:hypothetical protein CXG81DRAFT_9079 [Caulochytrium protostelioides]|eukprot:RKP03786.1 hypothetical protein CXG81DRAFT_9079 [Caulochytrium protostelioides]